MKQLLLLMAFILFSVNTKAQKNRNYYNKFNRHELSVCGFGGISTLLYSNEGNKNTKGTGAGGGLGYLYRFDSNWGLSTGIEIFTVSSKLTWAELIGKYNIEDSGGDLFQFNYTLLDYSEKQNMLLLALPIMIQYRAPIENFSTFFVSAGIKLGVPISSEIKMKPSHLTTTGYYEFENQMYRDLPNHGFVTDKLIEERKEKLDLGMSVMLSLESGLGFAINNKTSFYVGGYLDYGINNMQNNKKPVIRYQSSSPSDLQIGSILESDFIKSVNNMSIGLRVRIIFSFK